LRSLARIVFAFVFAAFAASFACAADRIGVHVTIEPTATGVLARFTFERPVPSFRLSYVSDDIRDRTWKFTTPDFTRKGTLITKADGESFDAFTVEVQTSTNRRMQSTPTYFALVRLAFYAGYFVGIDAAFETTIEVRPPSGHIVEGLPLGGNIWRVDAPFHRNAGDRYVYVGPASQLIKGRHAHFVFPANVPQALTARIRANVDGSLAFYARKLARPLHGKPLIIVAPNLESEASNNQGSATSGPMVVLRLLGKRWQTFDEKSDTFDHFIAHEAAHFWNSNTFRAAEGSPAWIWEGGAEIWALTARVAVMKRLSPKGRRDHIENALNNCAKALVDEPLVGHRSNATYVCGETLYWLADGREKAHARTRRHLLDLAADLRQGRPLRRHLHNARPAHAGRDRRNIRTPSPCFLATRETSAGRHCRRRRTARYQATEAPDADVAHLGDACAGPFVRRPARDVAIKTT
jgi:hypothetical protein